MTFASSYLNGLYFINIAPLFSTYIGYTENSPRSQFIYSHSYLAYFLECCTSHDGEQSHASRFHPSSRKTLLQHLHIYSSYNSIDKQDVKRTVDFNTDREESGFLADGCLGAALTGASSPVNFLPTETRKGSKKMLHANYSAIGGAVGFIHLADIPEMDAIGVLISANLKRFELRPVCSS